MAFAAILILCVFGTALGSNFTLDVNKTKAVDINCRRELLFKIVDKLNKRIIEQISNITECNKKINDTIDDCNTCRDNMCGQTVPITEAILQTLVAGTNVPLVFASDMIQETASWFNGAAAFLGTRGNDFANKLADTATTVGGAFEQTGGQMFSEMTGVFNGLGDNLRTIAEKLDQAFDAEGQLIVFLDFGQGVTGDLESFFSDALSSTESALSKAFDSIKDFFTGGFLWRRKRVFGRLKDRVGRQCVNSCPVCDKLDKDKYSVQQIIAKVCGSDAMENQAQAVEDIQWLQNLRNFTIDNKIITKIVIDYTPGAYTFDMSTGTIIAKNVYYTADDNVIRKYGSDYNVGNNVAAGKGLGAEYFLIRWNAKT